MADKKITQLTNITGANLVDADEFVVVDISVDETKSITLAELKTAFDSGSGFVRITGDTMSGDLTVPNLVVSGTVDGVDIAARDAILTSTTTTANAALPKAGGTMTGALDVGGTITSDGLTVQNVNDTTTNTAEFRNDNGNRTFRFAQNTSGDADLLLEKNDGTDAVLISTHGDSYFNGGNVGIGTDSPDKPLEVVATNTAMKISGTGVSSTGLLFETNGVERKKIGIPSGSSDLAFYSDAGSSEAMRINSSGHVGISTSSPAAALHVNSNLANLAGLFESTDAGATITLIDNGTTGGSAAEHGLNTVGDQLEIRAVDNLSFETAATERMRIASSGNVGIGTSSPTQALVVSESSTPTIQIKDGAASGTRVSGRLHIGESDTLGVSIENSTSTYNDNCAMVFKTSPAAGTITERMRIDSSGNIFFGATSASAPSYYFAPDSGGGSFISIKNSTNARTAFEFHNPNGTIGSITTSGSATAYNTSSDYRLKTDAQPMTGASARVQALNPVNFEWISDGSRVDGFLAHEAATVVPEAVTGTKDAMMDEEYQVSAATGDIYTAGVEAGFNEVSAAIEASPAYYDVDGNIIKAEVIAQAAVHEAYDEVDEVIHSADVEQPETLEDGQQWRETTAAVMGTRSVPDMQGIDQSKMVPLLVAALQEALARITALENA